MKYTALFISFILSWNLQAQTDTIRLFYLGGQSNMDGYGYNQDLPRELQKTFEDVWIFHGHPAEDGEIITDMGIWAPLQAGHGIGFGFVNGENQLSERFGVELSLAAYLQEKYPGDKIALIKYSRGGTSIDSLAAGSFGCWEPDFKGKNGVNQYDHFLATLAQAIQTKDIDENGQDDILLPHGVIWMQGESDASYSDDIAFRYHDHLKRLMDLMRASLLNGDLPVVIGKISDSYPEDRGKMWEHLDLIQYAQEKYTAEDQNAIIVRSTKDYDYSDPWHYDSQGYINLGEKFGEALYLLNQKK